jgi:glycosyltransferase involved in cell wall biosynthesis
MPRVHILTPYLIPGDAVSNDIFGMVRWLRLHNWPADAYAQYMDLSLHGQALPLASYQRHLHAREDILIYHHSARWELGGALFAQSRNRKVLRYHSVTPARFFRPYQRQYAEDCEQGELQTRTLLQLGPECVLADSPFNVEELLAAGADADRSRVVPPFHTIGDLDRLVEDEALAEELRGTTNILFVGRVVPNKGHLHLIRAFAYYHHYLDLNSRLFIVGRIDAELAGYLSDLHWEAARHDVEDAVHFTGLVSPRQLKTYYAHAGVFLCTSEHEGFCVPLVEAMHSGVPIVAYGSSAIPGTLGETGIVWDTPDPALLAESMNLIRTWDEVRETLIAAQRQRYEQCFSPEAVGAAFATALAPLLPPVEAYA